MCAIFGTGVHILCKYFTMSRVTSAELLPVHDVCVYDMKPGGNSSENALFVKYDLE